MSLDDIPRSLGRALDLLEAVLSRGTCNLTTAAGACDLSPTTALRHLRGLEARGYVERDTAGVFMAGPAMRRAARLVLDQGPIDRLLAVAQPHLDALAAVTEESCYVAVADTQGASYVASAEGVHPIRHVGWVGQRVTLAGTAVGAALADPGVVAVRTGAVEPDVTALSLALPDDPPVAAAISVIGPAHRLAGDRRATATEALLAMASELSVSLGWATRTKEMAQ